MLLASGAHGAVMTTKAQQAEQAEAVERLSEWIKPGDTIYTILRHVSSSGMSRSISLVRQDEDGPHDFSYLAARAMGDKIDQRWDGIKASGCGMDMGYSLVYNLSRVLFRDSFECIGEGCPSNDHSNGDRDYTPHMHSDGGYALRHRWL